MISVRHRFHGYGGLRPVYQRGQTVRSQIVNLKYLGRGSKSGWRAAVVVSKKVHKSAVVRNRIRRRMYEIIRRADDELVEGKDLVFTVFSERVADLPASKLEGAVIDLLKKSTGPAGQNNLQGRAIVKPEGKS